MTRSIEQTVQPTKSLSHGDPERSMPKGRRAGFSLRWWWIVPTVLIVVLLLLPSLVVIPMSFSPSEILTFPPTGFSMKWYENFIEDPQWTKAIGNSFAVALVTSVFAALIGTPAGIALGFRRWRGQGIVLALLVSPVIVPPMVIAVGMYVTYAQFDLTGFWGLVAAHTMLVTPFVVVTVIASVSQINPAAADAARSLGAAPFTVITRILLPLALPGIISGMLFAFVTSWDEVVVALYLTDPGFKTLPVVMWDQLRERVDPTVAAIATILLLITILIMIVVLLRGRRRKVGN
ncbi:ABC transporter permease [Agromyces subbeticus]|uniref:ABC transporter permease n=1 Tax=Agromyces subbeticus TaxID=293890 RepID=UPI0003B608E4|nr:ABC transporter permease [Agromyces subbeticus]